MPETDDSSAPRGPEITDLLDAATMGDVVSQAKLLEAVYRDLHAQAAAQMRRERPGHTLQPTALVHEAWLRLSPGEARFENRRHFFGAAARAMRQILVDHARQKRADKRGGEAEHVTFADLQVAAPDAPHVDLLALDRALDALQMHDARLAEVVQLRFFAGLSGDEIADLLGVTRRTVTRDWTYARAWLFERMDAGAQGESG